METISGESTVGRQTERRRFGQISKLPSGRYRARYADPEGRMMPLPPEAPEGRRPEPVRHAAPQTFDTREDAEAWLIAERRLVSAGVWTSPADRAKARAEADAEAARSQLTFGQYAEAWLIGRRVRGRALADRTRAHYRTLLDAHILPTFGETPLKAITPDDVDAWYATVAAGRPTLQAHAYSLLRTILATAVDRNLITTANPAKVRGGGTTNRAKKIRPATLDELAELVAAMPERHQLLTLLAAWCALRFGELAELRRRDIDTKTGVIRVRRGVVRADGRTIVKTPKSDAGVRDVAIPPHLLPLVREHLLAHAAPGADGLLFPAANGGHLAPSALYGRAPTETRAGWGFYAAREAASRPDLRWHDLRHTGAVLAARSNATLADLMGRLGHSTPGAALRYQHSALERDVDIARQLSAMVTEIPR